MNKLYFLLFIGILCLCACKSPKFNSGSETVPINPLIPDIEITEETLIKNADNSISGLSHTYEKMKNFVKNLPDFSKGIKEAKKIETNYNKRIEEILLLDLSTLTQEELISLTNEITDIVSEIRKVNDLFEFR